MASDGNEERNWIRIRAVRIEPTLLHIQSDSKHVIDVQSRDTIAKRSVLGEGAGIVRSGSSNWSRDMERERD